MAQMTGLMNMTHRHPGPSVSTPPSSTPTAQAVCRPAAEQHEAAVRQEVRAWHPLELLDGEPEVVADGRQGDVDDRDVDQVEEPDRAQQDEDQLAPRRRED